MTTTAEIMTTVRDILAADSALTAWCRENFGASPSIYLGIDDRNAPDASNYPMVAILGASRLRGSDLHKEVYAVEFYVALANSDMIQSMTPGNVPVYTAAGLLQIETLRDMCEDALFRARLTQANADGVSMTISDFPEFESISRITITLPASQRSGISKRL